MSKIQKAHLIYAVISLCAVFAYGAFLIRSNIKEVDTVEETLPHVIKETEATLPTEAVAEVINEEETLLKEVPTSYEEETERGFSPILPVEGTIVKNFSEKHTYNEKTGDWRPHMGIDISSSALAKVFSCEDGTVTACYQDPLWGNVIEIDHGEYISVYKNLSTLIMVKEGDSVRRNEPISGVGKASFSEQHPTPHLHFEMLHFGEFIDPLSVIN